MNPKPRIPDSEFRMSATEFDKAMREALATPAPKKPERPATKAEKDKKAKPPPRK